MVASGLVDDPRVSQFRLTLHLLLAFLIFGAMLWTALTLLAGRAARRRAARPRCARAGASRARLRRAGAADGRLGRTRRRHPRRLRVQHVPADERAAGAERGADARAGLAQLLLEHGDGAARPSRARAAARGRRSRGCGCACARRPTRRPRTARRARRRRGACSRSRSALGIATVVNVVPARRSPRCTRPAPCILFGLALVLAHALRTGAPIALTAQNGEHRTSSLAPPESDHGRDPRT